MPKTKRKHLLQISINPETLEEIKKYKNRYYDEFNMSAFFVFVMKEKIKGDIRNEKK